MILKRNIRYLQIALNSSLKEAQIIINQIPLSERILIEAGTPLIKEYGVEGIEKIRFWWEQRLLEFSSQGPELPEINVGGFRFSGNFLRTVQEQTKESQKLPKPYIIADIKCADLGQREVKMAAEAGATAVSCLGVAPVETIEAFIEECEQAGIDSMIDMMNVDQPVQVLARLQKLPDVVILHRGVDEETFNPEKTIPFNQIQQIKASYGILLSVAGGDTFQEVQRAVFNDVDIVVLWKSFYKNTNQTASLAEQFLKEIR